jgi:ADP-L-glycero-D-manno-heptose 6-epimerase
MIVLTGGAGMIGSMIAWHLNTILNENNFVIFDDLTSKIKKKILPKENLLILLIKMIFQNFLETIRILLL